METNGSQIGKLKMTTTQIIKRCTEKLGMTPDEAKWVAENLYTYECPDWSEWSWQQIDTCLRGVLFFRGKTDTEVMTALAG
jgi:hypothetical protein